MLEFSADPSECEQELQQSCCVVAIDFTVLIVAVTIQHLLCVEGYNICSLLVQQNCVCNVYSAVQIGITKRQLTRSDGCSSYAGGGSIALSVVEALLASVSSIACISGSCSSGSSCCSCILCVGRRSSCVVEDGSRSMYGASSSGKGSNPAQRRVPVDGALVYRPSLSVIQVALHRAIEPTL